MPDPAREAAGFVRGLSRASLGGPDRLISASGSRMLLFSRQEVIRLFHRNRKQNQVGCVPITEVPQSVQNRLQLTACVSGSRSPVVEQQDTRMGLA